MAHQAYISSTYADNRYNEESIEKFILRLVNDLQYWQQLDTQQDQLSRLPNNDPDLEPTDDLWLSSFSTLDDLWPNITYFLTNHFLYKITGDTFNNYLTAINLADIEQLELQHVSGATQSMTVTTPDQSMTITNYLETDVAYFQHFFIQVQEQQNLIQSVLKHEPHHNDGQSA